MVSRMSREKSTTPLEQDQGSDQTNYTSIQARAVRTRHPRPRGHGDRIKLLSEHELLKEICVPSRSFSLAL